ncbi:MAG: preprotein translocase subunit SecE [Bacteroidota bacterium]
MSSSQIFDSSDSIDPFDLSDIFFMNKVSNYFRDSFKELTEKVTWPNWTQLQQSTMIVLVATLVITAIVAAMDFVAAGGLQMIYKMMN